MAHPVASPELCRGGKDISCDCEEYSPPANPGDPAKCQECGHGKLKHPSGSADLSGKDSIKNIFDRVTKRSEKGNKSSLSVAKEEALSGYRPKRARSKAKSKNNADTDDSEMDGELMKSKVRAEFLVMGCPSGRIDSHGCICRQRPSELERRFQPL
jgi:hypothetical protein